MAVLTDNLERELDGIEVPKTESGDFQGKLNDWLRFIKAKSKEDFMQAAESSPLIKKAVEEVKWLSADEYTRELYKARLKNYRDEQARIEFGEQRGWNNGYSRGISEGREQGFSYVKDLLKQGLSAEEILKRI